MALGTNDVNVAKLKETDGAIRGNPGLEKLTVKAKVIAGAIYLALATAAFTLGGLWHHRTIQGDAVSCPTHLVLGGQQAVLRSLKR